MHSSNTHFAVYFFQPDSTPFREPAPSILKKTAGHLIDLLETEIISILIQLHFHPHPSHSFHSIHSSLQRFVSIKFRTCLSSSQFTNQLCCNEQVCELGYSSVTDYKMQSLSAICNPVFAFARICQ